MKYLCDNCENYPCDDSEIKLMYRCPAYKPIPKPMTNAMRIRAMTDEELADILARMCPPTMAPTETCFYALGDDSDGVDSACDLCWLDWLKEEAE